MSIKNIDYFVCVNKKEKKGHICCKACGFPCDVERNVNGPTGFVEGMGGGRTLHDSWTCTHSGQKWHDKAVRLYEEMEGTASRGIRRIIKSDLDDLIREEGPIPT